MLEFEPEDDDTEDQGETVEELKQRLEEIEAVLGDDLDDGEDQEDQDLNHIDALLEDMGNDPDDSIISVNAADISGSRVYRMTIPKAKALDLELDHTSQVYVRRVGDDGFLVKKI